MKGLHDIGLHVHKKTISFVIKTYAGQLVGRGQVTASRPTLAAWRNNCRGPAFRPCQGAVWGPGHLVPGDRQAFNMVEVQLAGAEVGGLEGCSNCFRQQPMRWYLIAVSSAEPDLRQDVTVSNVLEHQLRFSCEIGGSKTARHHSRTVDPILTNVQDPRLTISVNEVVAGLHGLVTYNEFKRNRDAKVAWAWRVNGCARQGCEHYQYYGNSNGLVVHRLSLCFPLESHFTL